MKITSTLAFVACAAALAVVVVGTLVSATILGAKRDAEPNVLLRRRFAKMHAEWPAKAATAASLQHHSKLLSAAAAVPPKSFDWMSKGCVRKVPFDEGQCGTGTVSGTTAYNIEGVKCAKEGGGKLVEVSAGQLTDCAAEQGAPGQGGCCGSEPYTMIDNMLNLTDGLVATEASYPYADGNGTFNTCKRDGWTVAAQVKGYVALRANRTDLMIQSLLKHGPLSVVVSPDFLYTYTGGVVTGANCAFSYYEHMLLVYGYGTVNGIDVWFTRNTFGNYPKGTESIIPIQRGVNCVGIEGMPSTVDVY